MTTTERTPRTTVRTLFDAIDAGKLDDVFALMADNVDFRLGNAAPTHGKQAFASTTKALFEAIVGIRHDIHNTWEISEDTVVCVMDVHYERRDGRVLTLPCCNVFRVREGLVHDYRIYMDITPVLTA